MLPLTVENRKMRDAADTPFVVVDTADLIHGAGRILKAYLYGLTALVSASDPNPLCEFPDS
jgi:hypothetical protein